MSDTCTCVSKKRVALALLLGGIAGALVIKAIPTLMERFMSGMMNQMMSRMKERGCSPPDM